SENAHREPWTGKWLPINNLFRQPELQSDLAHFVFKKLPDRFDKLEVHFFRQTADVVMSLDHCRRISADRNALDHVRIKRSLGEKTKFRISDFGFRIAFCKSASRTDSSCGEIDNRMFEHANKLLPDSLSLLFRIDYPFECFEEAFGGVDIFEPNMKIFAEDAL